MKNAIGTFLRRLRIKKGERLKDMAINLNVSSAFLSAVENGKKKFPKSWDERIKKIYKLDVQEFENLNQAIIETTNKVEIDIEKSSKASKDLAVCFARKFNDLDDEVSSDIFKLLNSRKED